MPDEPKELTLAEVCELRQLEAAAERMCDRNCGEYQDAECPGGDGPCPCDVQRFEDALRTKATALLRAAEVVAAMERWQLYAFRFSAGWRPYRRDNLSSDFYRDTGYCNWPTAGEAILAAAKWLEEREKSK